MHHSERAQNDGPHLATACCINQERLRENGMSDGCGRKRVWDLCGRETVPCRASRPNRRTWNGERSCETVAASRENENGQPRTPNGESHAKNQSLQSKRGNSRRSTIGVGVCVGRHGQRQTVGQATREAPSQRIWVRDSKRESNTGARPGVSGGWLAMADITEWCGENHRPITHTRQGLAG